MPGNTNKRRRRIQSGPFKGFVPFRQYRSVQQHGIQIVVILLALWVYKQFGFRSATHCKDPSDVLCPDKYFSDTFLDARSQFLSLSAKQSNAEMYHLPVYALSDDEPLTMDITLLNANSSANHLLIHMSGTHGVEGYAGSAVQIAILEYFQNMSSSDATISALFSDDTQCNMAGDDAPIVMLVHAFNPYGFHFDRRVNEHNVDLNRNYKTKEEWDEYTKSDKDAYCYQSLSAFFNPKYDLKHMVEVSDMLPSSKFVRGVWSMWYYWQFFIDGAYQILSVGLRRIEEPAIMGQWYDPQGLQYNGAPYKLEASHAIFQDFLSQKMFTEIHPQWTQQISRISFIDVHTGLGRYGVDTLICDEQGAHKLQQLMPDHERDGLIVPVSSVLNGAYKNVNGYTFQHLRALVQNVWHARQEPGNAIDIDILAVAQEFGTFGTSWVMAAMRLENGFTQSYNAYVQSKQNSVDHDSNLLDKMQHLVNISRTRYKNMFYVQAVDWKTSIVQRGFQLFASAYNR